MIIPIIIACVSIVLLMIVHEFGHFVIAKKFGIKVEEFGIGYPPRIFGKKFGETIYSVNWIPFGAFVKIYGEDLPAGRQGVDVDDYRSFSYLAIWKRILICLGGVIAFWLAAIVIFSIAFGLGVEVPIGDQAVPNLTDTNIKIMAVNPNSPAQNAGLKIGDEVVNVQTVTEFQTLVQNNKGKEIQLTIKRNGQTINISLTPRVSYREGDGPTGVAIERFAKIIKQYPWYEAPIKGTIYTGTVTWESLKGIYGFFMNLFQGKGVPEGAELAGPLGITIFLSRAINYGLGFFLYFIGSLTVLLAIFNLFPIPALDGGKIIFLIIEKIMKKPVPVKWEQGVTIFFFILLVTMSVFITIKFDIPRVIDLWKSGI